MSENEAAILRIVRRIPRGRVATYGQIAALAGFAGAARRVGYALNRSTPEDRLPWHRVVNARGEISHRPDREGGEHEQRHRLEAEGVVFDQRGGIDLDRFRWRPGPGIVAEGRRRAKPY